MANINHSNPQLFQFAQGASQADHQGGYIGRAHAWLLRTSHGPIVSSLDPFLNCIGRVMLYASFGIHHLQSTQVPFILIFGFLWCAELIHPGLTKLSKENLRVTWGNRWLPVPGDGSLNGVLFWGLLKGTENVFSRKLMEFRVSSRKASSF